MKFTTGYDGPYDAPVKLPKKRVLKSWIDYNGHMNVAFYTMAFDKSLDIFLEKTLGLGETHARENAQGPFVVQANFHYLNEMKRGIKIPGSKMFQIITDEFENLVAYEPHSELDEYGNKKTPLNVAQRFLDVTGYVTGSISRDDQIGTVTSYDYGPSATLNTAGVATVTTSQTVNV